MAFYRSPVLVCVDPECLAKGAHEVVDALQDEFIAQGLNDEFRIGACGSGPEMMVYPEGVHYVGMTPDAIPFLVVDQSTCIKCGICVQVCNFNAVAVELERKEKSLTEV